jgi:hypothetical protein
MPLFQAATAIVAADPYAYPIRGYVHLTITPSESLPDVWPEHGYSVPTAIIEVLVDARLLEDEDQARAFGRRSSRGEGGTPVYIEESRTGGYSIGPTSPPPRAE